MIRTTDLLFIGALLALLITGCKSSDITPKYSSKYIQANKGKLKADVAEVYELGYVVLALTNFAHNDTSVINTSSAYYKDLDRYFANYKQHHTVNELNDKLKRFPKLLDYYLKGLYVYRMNNGRVVQKEDYRIDLNKMEFSRYQLLLQEFYRDTNFKKFFADHRNTYDQMVKTTNEQIDIEKARTQIGEADGYQVILSPLVKGHADEFLIGNDQYKEYIVYPYIVSGKITFGKASNL